MNQLPPPQKIGSIQVGNSTPKIQSDPAMGLNQYKWETLRAFLHDYEAKANPDEWDTKRLTAIRAEIARREAK